MMYGLQNFPTPPSDIELRVRALESLLVDKGLVDPATLDALIDTYEHKIGPQNGARVVARAHASRSGRQSLQHGQATPCGCLPLF